MNDIDLFFDLNNQSNNKILYGGSFYDAFTKLLNLQKLKKYKIIDYSLINEYNELYNKNNINFLNELTDYIGIDSVNNLLKKLDINNINKYDKKYLINTPLILLFLIKLYKNNNLILAPNIYQINKKNNIYNILFYKKNFINLLSDDLSNNDIISKIDDLDINLFDIFYKFFKLDMIDFIKLCILKKSYEYIKPIDDYYNYNQIYTDIFNNFDGNYKLDETRFITKLKNTGLYGEYATKLYNCMTKKIFPNTGSIPLGSTSITLTNAIKNNVITYFDETSIRIEVSKSIENMLLISKNSIKENKLPRYVFALNHMIGKIKSQNFLTKFGDLYNKIAGGHTTLIIFDRINKKGYLIDSITTLLEKNKEEYNNVFKEYDFTIINSNIQVFIESEYYANIINTIIKSYPKTFLNNELRIGLNNTDYFGYCGAYSLLMIYCIAYLEKNNNNIDIKNFIKFFYNNYSPLYVFIIIRKFIKFIEYKIECNEYLKS